MITYEFDRLTYGGSEKIKITVPNNFKFIIFDKYNDKIILDINTSTINSSRTNNNYQIKWRPRLESNQRPIA